MEIRRLQTDAERRAAVPILQELWTEKSAADILTWMDAPDYHAFGRFDDDLVGVAGVTECSTLHHVEMAWLYDLVVALDRRGEGHGTALLDQVTAWADEAGYDRIGLASPLDNGEAQDWYTDRGFEPWGYVIEREC